MHSEPRNLRAELPAESLAVILRHYKERKSKCTVQPLVGDPRFQFVTFDPELRLQADGFTVLEIEAPALEPADADRPLLLLDSTWRYLPALRAAIEGSFVERSLPPALRTAYRRSSKIAPDPDAGLASVEALYAALRILGLRDDGLLDQYHWRDAFLKRCEEAALP